MEIHRFMQGLLYLYERCKRVLIARLPQEYSFCCGEKKVALNIQSNTLLNDPTIICKQKLSKVFVRFILKKDFCFTFIQVIF